MDENNNITALTPTRRPDAELALEYKRRGMEKLLEICELMNEAREQGLILNIQIGNDPFGRFVPAQLTVVKPL